MNQEQRVLLAVALSAVIFIVYQSFFAPPAPMQPVPQTVTQTASPQDAVPGKTATSAATSGEDFADPEFVAEPKSLAIETGKFKAVLDTVGGVITSYELKEYQAGTGEKDSKFKDVVAETPDSAVSFYGLDGYPGLNAERVFQIVTDETASDGSRHVTLAWQDKNLRVEKAFTFGIPSSPYVILQSAKIAGRANGGYAFTPYLEDRVRQKPQQGESSFLSSIFQARPDLFGAAYFKGDQLFARSEESAAKRKAFSLVAHPTSKWDASYAAVKDEGAIAWSGVTDRYFLVAQAPDFASDEKAAAARTGAEFKREGDFLVSRFSLPKIVLNSGETASSSWLTYVGPKKLSELPKAGVGLEKAVDYGWFHVLATPILWLMIALHKVIPNWGLVIIALTFIVKMALHPVNKKSLASMKAMQQLQPKMQEIKKRHADDPQKQNEEIMQLFRTHKVNPMGGCLPMLLQMPIYVVLYNVLWNAIELYHSPFLWYRDLSAPDPYFVAPVLLGVFMFLQQKLTPSATADPAQQKMMMFMPVMFSVFMLFVPVGLVVYIFVNTLMSVVQQFMLQRELSFKDLVTGKWQANGA